MFGSDKSSNQQKRGAPQKDTGVTILTAGCHFTGKLYCRGATRIGGTIEGQVIAEGLLVVEEEAVIHGEIDAEDIVIHGRIEGKVEGRNRVEMCTTADVQADIGTPSLVVHDGALFNGKTAMKRKAVASPTTMDKKSGHKQPSQGRKTDDRVEDRSVSAMPDIKAARISDVQLSDLEPEPAL